MSWEMRWNIVMCQDPISAWSASYSGAQHLQPTYQPVATPHTGQCRQHQTLLPQQGNVLGGPFLNSLADSWSPGLDHSLGKQLIISDKIHKRTHQRPSVSRYCQRLLGLSSGWEDFRGPRWKETLFWSPSRKHFTVADKRLVSWLVRKVIRPVVGQMVEQSCYQYLWNFATTITDSQLKPLHKYLDKI